MKPDILSIQVDTVIGAEYSGCRHIIKVSLLNISDETLYVEREDLAAAIFDSENDTALSMTFLIDKKFDSLLSLEPSFSEVISSNIIKRSICRKVKKNNDKLASAKLEDREYYIIKPNKKICIYQTIVIPSYQFIGAKKVYSKNNSVTFQGIAFNILYKTVLTGDLKLAFIIQRSEKAERLLSGTR